MLKLELIEAGQQITGIEQDRIVRMVSATPHNGKIEPDWGEGLAILSHFD